jgi:hypothetical protein
LTNLEFDNLKTDGNVVGIVGLSTMLLIERITVKNINTKASFLQGLFSSLSETWVNHIVWYGSRYTPISKFQDFLFQNVTVDNMISMSNSKLVVEDIVAIDDINIGSSFLTVYESNFNVTDVEFRGKVGQEFLRLDFSKYKYFAPHVQNIAIYDSTINTVMFVYGHETELAYNNITLSNVETQIMFLTSLNTKLKLNDWKGTNLTISATGFDMEESSIELRTSKFENITVVE